MHPKFPDETQNNNDNMYHNITMFLCREILHIAIEMLLFAVVVFLEDNKVAGVPSVWMTNDERHSYWPPFKNMTRSQLDSLVKEETKPDESWTLFQCRILKWVPYSQLEDKLKLATQQSDLETTGYDEQPKTVRYQKNPKGIGNGKKKTSKPTGWFFSQ